MGRYSAAIRNAAAALIFLALCAAVLVFAQQIIKSDGTDGAESGADVSYDAANSETGADEDTAAPEMPASQSFIHRIGEDTYRKGAQTHGKYDGETMKLALLDTDMYRLENTFSLSKKTVETPKKIPDKVFGTYSVEYVNEEVERAQVELYDGMLIIDRGERLELYGFDGKLIDDNLRYVPAYFRDSDGRPVFCRGGENFVLINGIFTKTDADSETDMRSVSYENTSDFANENGGLEAAFGEDGLCALADAEGNILTGYDYKRIFSFSEGLAAAERADDGSLCYIDREGKTVIEGVDTYRNTSDRYVDSVYCLPGVRGEETVGFVYFTGGIALVREKVVDYVYKENTISDTTSVIKSNGEKLYYPSDYTPLYGGDGVVVMEKDGRYGVYTADERWALQPVYDSVSPFHEGLAVVGRDGKYGMCDTNGNIVVDIAFDYISVPSGSRIAAYSKECGFVIFEKQTKN